MKKIAILTDSCCDLSMEDIAKNNIFLLPVRVIYKDKQYLDKIEISPEEVFRRLSEEIPTTSLPDMGYASRILEGLIEQGYTDVVVVTVSSNLSGTYNAIRLMSEDYPQLKFNIFDSKTLGFPQGAIVLEAAKLIRKDVVIDELLNALENIRRKTVGYVVVNTLEYLEKGGRLGPVASKIGTLLKIKPILTSTEVGLLECCDKVRGQKQSLSRLKKYVQERTLTRECRVWVLEGAAKEEALELLKEFKEYINIKDLSIQQIGASMGVHTGPQSIGVCIQEIV